jgi:hypothetical protein
MGTPRRKRLAPVPTGTAGATDTSDHAAAAPDAVWVCRSATLPRAASRFYRALLLAFPAQGGPPDRAAVRQLARRFQVGLEATLARLAAQDLVQRDPATGAISAAYPFSGVPTPHRVALLPDHADTSTTEVYAMCALDALGIPLMLGRDAAITSADPLSGEAVRVDVGRADIAAEIGSRRGESGLPGWWAAWQPATAVIYARPEDDACDGGAMAALCRCPVTNFFATPAQAKRWAKGNGAPGDVVLAPDEALPRAERRFGGILDRLSADDQAR